MELDKTLQKITEKHPGKQVLAGDFNSPDTDWDTAAVASNAAGRQLQLLENGQRMKFNAQKCYILLTNRSPFLYGLGGVILKQV